MKRLIQALFAVWVFSFFLWFILQVNPAAYIQLRANGAQWFQCTDWDENGRPYASDQCVGAPPEFDPGI